MAFLLLYHIIMIFYNNKKSLYIHHEPTSLYLDFLLMLLQSYGLYFNIQTILNKKSCK